MQQDRFAYDVDELVGPNKGSVRPLVIGLATMLGIGVLSALVLMEPPMATSFEVTDEDRLARMLALAPADDAASDPPLPMSGDLSGADDTAAGSSIRIADTTDPDRSSAADLEGVLAGERKDSTAPRLRGAVSEPGDTALPRQIASVSEAAGRTDAPGERVASAPRAIASIPAPPATDDPLAVRPVSAAVENTGHTLATAPIPTPKPVRRPRSASAPIPAIGQAADGPYAIQFGSMSTREKAAAEIARFRAEAPALFARAETSIETTRLDDGREVNRMRIQGVTSKADARAWCRAFKAQGGSCYVIG